MSKSSNGLVCFSFLTLALLVFAVACGPRYEFKPVPVRDMDNYKNQTSVNDVRIGGEAFFDSAKLKEIFGFDLKKAGVMPVQVLLENNSRHDVDLKYGSTILDENGQRWEVLPTQVVFERLDQYTSGSLSGRQGVQRTMLWGLAGGIVGAAVGVVSGTDVGEAAGKGAAIGAAAGAASSIITPTIEGDETSISRDFSERDMESKVIEPGESVHGLLYFPAESARPVQLRLILEGNAGHNQQIDLELK